MARLTFGAAKQAAGAAILINGINGAARRTALGNLIEAICAQPARWNGRDSRSSRRIRRRLGVVHGLRREADKNVERRLT